MRLVGDRFSLIEKPGGDCIFWDKQAGCTVYPARPDQCRTWPFWPENVARRKDWEHVCEVCPGPGQGRVHTLAEIQNSLAMTPKMIAPHEPSLVDRDSPRPSYCEELEALYASLEAEVARLAPVCLVSGRCCRFREYGHTLFLSAPEMRVPPAPGAPSRFATLDDGQTCPWQDASGRCTARRGPAPGLPRLLL